LVKQGKQLRKACQSSINQLHDYLVFNQKVDWSFNQPRDYLRFNQPFDRKRIDCDRALDSTGRRRSRPPASLSPIPITETI
jgi:hypothetical protein